MAAASAGTERVQALPCVDAECSLVGASGGEFSQLDEAQPGLLKALGPGSFI